MSQFVSYNITTEREHQGMEKELHKVLHPSLSVTRQADIRTIPCTDREKHVLYRKRLRPKKEPEGLLQ